MKQRLLAGLGAVALIVVAVVARGLIGGDDGGTDPARPGGGRPVVGCTPDLAALCRGLADAGVIAADPPTFDLGTKAAKTGRADDRDVDGWITWDPAWAVANLDAGPDGPVWADPVAVGSAPVAVIFKGDVPAPCVAAGFDWACLPDAAVDHGAAVAIGDPATAEGLARLYPLAAALVDRDDTDFTTIDAASLGDVIDSPNAGQGTFVATVNDFVTKPGAYTAVVGPQPGLKAASADGIRATTITPGPPGAPMTIVVAGRPGRDLGSVHDAMARPEIARAIGSTGVTPGKTALAPPDRGGEWFALRKAAQ